MTAKQKRFCEEYLIDLNATQAAIRAGYSPETAKSVGSENLTKPDLRARIDREIAERSRRTGVSADRVVRELAKLAFVKATDIIDPVTATVRDTASEEDKACIAAVKYKASSGESSDSVEREIRLCDKLKALELLGRHLGMFSDKLTVSTPSDGCLADILKQLGGPGEDKTV